MCVRSPIFWSARDWADAIASLPVAGALPCRTVLVPNERVAHALRRELIRAGLGHALAGTRFVPVGAAALAVLEAAGIECKAGEEALRRARVLTALRAGLSLEHFPLDLLNAKPGWDEAFASTMTELEAADLRADDLTQHPLAQFRDIGRLWQVVDASAGTSLTLDRIYLEAATRLERDPARWPYRGPVLATARGDVTAARARFLRAIPDVVIGLIAGRPARESYIERVAALFGKSAAEALRTSGVPRARGSERDLLASYFLEPAEMLADPSRPRSAGPDGSVQLEEHAGLEAEIEAAADWVARQIMDGTPLEEIAILLPALDPLATLVAERLARLPWPDGPLPVHVAGGLPLTSTASGARALAVVRALRAHLSGEALAEVLPALRPVDPEGRHLSRGAAMDLVWSLGAVGGNSAHPEGALDWAARAIRREPDLAAQLEQARAAGDDPEQAGVARKARDLERLIQDLRAVRPAIEALVDVARLVIYRAPLSRVWPALRGFLDDWLLQPGAGPRADALLDERLTPMASDGVCGSLGGDEALVLVQAAIRSLRVPIGRFGEPAVYVGSMNAVAGLSFRAVRVIGLAEGHVPSLPHEDPVLPDALRRQLVRPRTIGPQTAADRALAALHALDVAVRAAQARVVLSAPRLDIDRSLREPASVILEAAAALGRPNSATGEAGAPIPSAAALRRDAFAPARHANVDFRLSTPVGETAWHDAVASRHLTIPPRWQHLPALDLDRAASPRAGARFGALDGLLGPLTVPMPGLTPDRPISPSALQALLQCPHRFLLASVLHFDEPTSAPSTHEIGQPAYGSLFHRAAEEFYRAHGAAFCARQETIIAWCERADVIADRVFAEFLEQYPLVGGAVIGRQRNRLLGDLRELLEHEWAGAAISRFVAVERGFGRPVPVQIECGGRWLFVRGRIDRMEVLGPHTVIRDLKTGRAHPRRGREAAPDAVLDIQIAVYGLVARLLAAEWGVPDRVSAGYAYVGHGADERAWQELGEELEPAARQWLALAADLLEARAFPRTPDPNDCKYCHLQPVCGKGAQERAAMLLDGGDPLLARFRALKHPATDAED
jgi:RecB family exonuclease